MGCWQAFIVTKVWNKYMDCSDGTRIFVTVDSLDTLEECDRTTRSAQPNCASGKRCGRERSLC